MDALVLLSSNTSVIKPHTYVDCFLHGTLDSYYFSGALLMKKNYFCVDPGQAEHALEACPESSNQRSCKKVNKVTRERSLLSLLREMASRALVIFFIFLWCHPGEFSSDFCEFLASLLRHCRDS